mgnify:CR=1 FL=1
MSPKQKIAPNCSFFAIRDRREFPRSQIKAQKRSKMAILRLFSALRERRGVPNRKKVAIRAVFLFSVFSQRVQGGIRGVRGPSPALQDDPGAVQV